MQELHLIFGEDSSIPVSMILLAMDQAVLTLHLIGYLFREVGLDNFHVKLAERVRCLFVLMLKQHWELRTGMW